MRLKVLIVAAPLLLIAVYCAAWWYLSERARDTVTAWTESLPADLATVQVGEMRRGGFPFAVRWSFDTPVATARWALGATRTRAGEISLWAELWSPNTLHFSAASVASLAHHDPTGRAWRLGLEMLSGSLSGKDDGGFEVLYEASKVRVDEIEPEDLSTRAGAGDRETVIEPVADALSATGSLVGPYASDGMPGHLARLMLEGLRVPRVQAMLGAATGSFETWLDLRGSLGDASIEDVVAWRDAGGVLDIAHLRLGWRPLEFGFQGTAALDEQLRLLGAGTAEIRGLTDLLDILVVKGVVKRSEATVAKLGLALLTRPAKDGGGAVVRLPLTAQNGELRGGPFRIGRLPPIVR